jgi:hypothetical protein
MVLGTVDVLDARDPAIDTAPALAGEAEHAVKARIAARRGLDTALAFVRNFEALAPRQTVRRGVAKAASGKDALLDR